MIDEVAFKSATTVATVMLGSSKRGIQIAVKLSNATELFDELAIPEVEFSDEFDGRELLAMAAVPEAYWRASKYWTYHRIQSFQRAFVHLLGSGLD
jgi:hypothetical protein